MIGNLESRANEAKKLVKGSNKVAEIKHLTKSEANNLKENYFSGSYKVVGIDKMKSEEIKNPNKPYVLCVASYGGTQNA